MTTPTDEQVEAAQTEFFAIVESGGFADEAEAANAGLRAALTAAFSLAAPAIEWRCFHCGQVFTDRIMAETHFGKSADIDPACLSSVKKMREHVLASLSAERAP